MHDTVSANSIADMVDVFYGNVRHDALLGPIFAAAIGGEWTAHLATMKSFWSSVLLASRTYKGNPLATHLRLPPLTETHFSRWLKLWGETAENLCSPELAELFVLKAEAIAARLFQAVSLNRAGPLVQMERTAPTL